ncbi:hypothetical protein AVEN_77934-1 [Araneus ventricosus]|uniref:Uncharacterized protein n=1 Tax=Araneus ventricosus TaxID=182803 RepID=A0A4Y2DWN4_ARAVE|nr:hypothetical protein AVEN_77934-1 [Araneus ventricosus]
MVREEVMETLAPLAAPRQRNTTSQLSVSVTDSLSRKPLIESVVENCDEIPSLAAITDYRKEQLKDKHLKSIIRTLEKGDGYQSYQMRNNVL